MHSTVFHFCVCVTISLKCDVISLRGTSPPGLTCLFYEEMWTIQHAGRICPTNAYIYILIHKKANLPIQHWLMMSINVFEKGLYVHRNIRSAWNFIDRCHSFSQYIIRYTLYLFYIIYHLLPFLKPITNKQPFDAITLFVVLYFLMS